MNTHFLVIFSTVQFVRNVLITTAGIKILFSSFENTVDASLGSKLSLQRIKPIKIKVNKTAIWKITDVNMFIVPPPKIRKYVIAVKHIICRKFSIITSVKIINYKCKKTYQTYSRNHSRTDKAEVWNRNRIPVDFLKIQRFAEKSADYESHKNTKRKNYSTVGDEHPLFGDIFHSAVCPECIDYNGRH